MLLFKLKIILLLILAFISFGLGKKTVEKVYAAPSDVGQWSAVQQWPIKSTHATLLPNGKVIIWPTKIVNETHIWNPKTNSITKTNQAGYNIFCSGHTLTADGKLFVAGGHVDSPIGLEHASFFDFSNNSWTRVPDMNDKRWYPTTTTLSDGNILVIAGNIRNGVDNDLPQIYQTSTNSWRDLTGARLAVSRYPFMYQTSSGGVFMAGYFKETRFLNTSGTGSWGPIINTNFGSRDSSTSVMYENNKILIIGGGVNGTNTVEKINLGDLSPTWTYTNPMSVKRRHANATLLPTGEVLVTGGTRGLADDKTLPAYAAEVWNPSTGNWKILSRSAVYRGYHATSLLLPDGRVLVAGGEKSGKSMEIFSPPYLFKGTRPVISSAPSQVDYGKKFRVQTPNAASITNVRWIRLGSVTHSFNMSQRINKLTIVSRTSNSLDLSFPTNAGTTPPGHYMLFILNGKGVPSVAKIIKVGNYTMFAPSPALPSITTSPESGLQQEFNEEEMNQHLQHGE